MKKLALVLLVMVAVIAAARFLFAEEKKGLCFDDLCFDAPKGSALVLGNGRYEPSFTINMNEGILKIEYNGLTPTEAAKLFFKLLTKETLTQCNCPNEYFVYIDDKGPYVWKREYLSQDVYEDGRFTETFLPCLEN